MKDQLAEKRKSQISARAIAKIRNAVGLVHNLKLKRELEAKDKELAEAKEQLSARGPGDGGFEGGKLRGRAISVASMGKMGGATQGTQGTHATRL